MNKELKSVLSTTAPKNTNSVWYQPTEEGIKEKVFNRDKWKEINNSSNVEVDQQLNGYSTNAVANKAVYAQFLVQQDAISKAQEEVNKSLKKGDLDWEATTYKDGHIKNRTHHMKDYMCNYFKGQPIKISKPSDTGYVVLAYDTDMDNKYLRVEIKANESKTEEFLDAMGLPIIFTWDAGASTINVQTFSGAAETMCMGAYYSSSATSFDDYFVKLDKGFLPQSAVLPEGVKIEPSKDGSKLILSFNGKSTELSLT